MNQHCPTMIIAPNGEILEEIVSDKLCCLKKEIELDEISDWYINQCRNDIIKLTKGERKGQLTLNSLYICVKDMDRAISFYEQFFEQQVDKNHDTFSIFNISGFRFCLFNNSKVNEDVTWGDNCLPSFEVNDMDNLIEKLKVLNAEIVFPLTKINENWVLEFRDSEGIDIEVYSKI